MIHKPLPFEEKDELWTLGSEIGVVPAEHEKDVKVIERAKAHVGVDHDVVRASSVAKLVRTTNGGITDVILCPPDLPDPIVVSPRCIHVPPRGHLGPLTLYARRGLLQFHKTKDAAKQAAVSHGAGGFWLAETDDGRFLTLPLELYDE